MLDKEINLLWSRGAVEAIAASLKFFGRFFVVPKGSSVFSPSLRFVGPEQVFVHKTVQKGLYTHASRKAEFLLLFCHQQDIFLRARHVTEKLNIIADSLSRPHCIRYTECTLARKILLPIWEIWHKPIVDLIFF